MRRKTIFIKPKSKRLARAIDITSPTAFKRSINKLKKGGLTLREKRALVLGRNIASAHLRRKNLSPKERKQMTAIANMNLPKVTR